MSIIELAKYYIKTLIDFKYKRSVFTWGIRYFSISLVVELGKIAAGSKLDLFYELIDKEFGSIAFVLFWIIIEIVLVGK